MTNPRKITTSSLKSRFSRRFLRALIRINNSNPSPKSSTTISRSAIRKYGRVKVAAYASMALAVGTRRAWSRATLRNIRRQKSSSLFLKRDGSSSKNTVAAIPQPPPPLIRKEGIVKKKKKMMMKEGNIGDEGTQLEMKKLRELVPGGEDMEACCLLEETADYITCLATQVQVMKRIADLCCP